MDESPFEDVEFDVGGYVLRGRLYKTAQSELNDSRPLIALHGWLDNCASFSFLAPLLSHANCTVLALDLSGHGNSDHRLGLGAYNIWQDIPEVIEVAAQLGWSQFGLVGHSRGAMISTLMGALCPEKVNFIGLVDGIVPIPVKEDEYLEQFRRAILGAETVKQRPRTYYESFGAAVAAREKGFIALGHKDALVLAERGVKQDKDRYYWANDKKLLIPSEVKFTDKQIKTMMAELKVDVHLIIGSEGLVNDFAYIIEWLKGFNGVKIHHLKGGHHLHMSEAAGKVAKLIINALPEKQTQ